jgi:hypothetical protein
VWETVVVVAVILAAVAYVGFKLARTATGKSSGCDGCSTGGCGACKTQNPAPPPGSKDTPHDDDS